MRLNRIINDLQRNARTGNLDLRNLAFGYLIADRIHHIGGLHGQQAGHLNIGARFGNALFPNALVGNALAKRRAAHQTLAHFFQCRSATPMVRMQW